VLVGVGVKVEVGVGVLVEFGGLLGVDEGKGSTSPLLTTLLASPLSFSDIHATSKNDDFMSPWPVHF
jgi:hypothetical protein